tara:strand:- start:1688 stop:1918 length:231 start_codon:yes stop_codon:yes gene_type:complete
MVEKNKESKILDKINPPYYVGARIQVSDFISEFKLDYFSGNVIKYVVRQKFKNGLEDLKKAKWYLDKLISTHPDSK